ncbi:MAG: type II toxin-antitoxin system RelE/ParE family toxin [bacterium]|nr:type II toxin-antitoxin system RelE/ParE family toxin [bacterium]
MKYRVRIEDSVKDEIRYLTRKEIRQLDKAILNLVENPRPVGVKKLVGREREGWRIKVGHYRILYKIDDKERLVTIYRIKHRKEAYRRS